MKNDDHNPIFSNAWGIANLPRFSFLVSIVGSAGMIGLTIFKHPTPFETAFLQFLILLTGLWGSYIIGKHSACRLREK